MCSFKVFSFFYGSLSQWLHDGSFFQSGSGLHSGKSPGRESREVVLLVTQTSTLQRFRSEHGCKNMAVPGEKLQPVQWRDGLI